MGWLALQSDGARSKLKCAVRSAPDAPVQWEKEAVEMAPSTAEDAALPPIVSKILPSGNYFLCIRGRVRLVGRQVTARSRRDRAEIAPRSRRDVDLRRRDRSLRAHTAHCAEGRRECLLDEARHADPPRCRHGVRPSRQQHPRILVPRRAERCRPVAKGAALRSPRDSPQILRDPKLSIQH